MNKNLKPLLEAAIRQFSPLDRRDHDPVGKVWEFHHQKDHEVVALLASSLAYGRVELLRAAISRALEPLGPHPAEFLRRINLEAIPELCPDFTYRMTRGPDLADLATALAQTLRSERSLQALYQSCIPAGALPTNASGQEEHLLRASFFVQELRRRRCRPSLHRGFRYLLPDPGDGSTCKRLHLFFRWMVRGPDGIDFGHWATPGPADLIMPLDTHTTRLCRYLGLLHRRTVDAKAALQVSQNLAIIAPDDPLRYDFALCHLGISGACIHRRSPDHCPGCPIESACTL